MHELARPLQATLESVASKPTADRWIDVLRTLQPDEHGDVEPSLASLLRVAQFRTAAEAYRLDPTVLDSAGEVAVGLMEFDMLEAAPAVIVEAIKAHPEPRAVAAALSLTMQAMTRAADGDSARRVFRASTPLIDLADAARAKTQPSASSVRALMGEIELRDGHVADARALLQKAAATERTGPVSATLARIARSEGRTDEALSNLNEALRSPEASKSPALRGEILLMTSDILRERGQMDAARNALSDALRGLAEARRAQADADAKARVERTLAKVLDRFGANQKAKQALDRAFDAAPRDKQEASATILTMASRALFHGDLGGAREDLRRGVAADLPNDDLVYLALWARILERQKKSTVDPLVERTFASIHDDGRWTGRLAAFGLGKVKINDLAASAKTPAQKIEALFYQAMEQRIGGDPKGSEATLQRVVQSSGGIELMEVSIARDILSGGRAVLSGPVPDVGLP
jgi:tetratricopeptide (TPR) repeat protein